MLSVCLSGAGDDGVYQLELDLTSLHFTHHPLFSVEHVLASRLQQACRQHASKLASKTTEYHNERVSACEMIAIVIVHLIPIFLTIAFCIFSVLFA